MTISSLTKKAALSLALATAAMSSAYASQHDIQIWANVDPLLDLRKADGTPLWDAVQMTYRPGTGLDTWSEHVRIYTNDVTQDVAVRLANLPELKLEGTSISEPLTVSLNGADLGTTNTIFEATNLFPSGTVDGESIYIPLAIRQTTRQELDTAGRYAGTVSIVMFQQDPTP
nr:CS1 type fimbrial major subunit [Stenotrophomonas geniculata]